MILWTVNLQKRWCKTPPILHQSHVVIVCSNLVISQRTTVLITVVFPCVSWELNHILDLSVISQRFFSEKDWDTLRLVHVSTWTTPLIPLSGFNAVWTLTGWSWPALNFPTHHKHNIEKWGKAYKLLSRRFSIHIPQQTCTCKDQPYVT